MLERAGLRLYLGENKMTQLELFPLRFFVNVYDAASAYGGPEEGGWYYNDYTFIGCYGAFPDFESADLRA